MPDAALPALRQILVVEHAEDLVTLFEGVIQAHFGCQVVTAGNFAQAVSDLERQPFDFVLSDLVLPGTGGNGLALGEWLRVHRPALHHRFVIVTATSGSEELVQTERRGEVRVLYKPFNATQLVQAIEQTLQVAAQ